MVCLSRQTKGRDERRERWRLGKEERKGLKPWGLPASIYARETPALGEPHPQENRTKPANGLHYRQRHLRHTLACVESCLEILRPRRTGRKRGGWCCKICLQRLQGPASWSMWSTTSQTAALPPAHSTAQRAKSWGWILCHEHFTSTLQLEMRESKDCAGILVERDNLGPRRGQEEKLELGCREAIRVAGFEVIRCFLCVGRGRGANFGISLLASLVMSLVKVVGVRWWC